MSEDVCFSEVKLIEFVLVIYFDIVLVGSVDFVLIFRNVYNWYMGKDKEGVLSVFKVFYKVFKLGGILGVVEYCFFELCSDED